jgi:hypothetical protein
MGRGSCHVLRNECPIEVSLIDGFNINFTAIFDNLPSYRASFQSGIIENLIADV